MKKWIFALLMFSMLLPAAEKISETSKQKDEKNGMIQLHALFSNGAVLQRRMWVPVWGKGVRGHLMEVKINGSAACARCGSDGSFIARLAPMEAGGPYKLTVTDCDTGKSVSVSDVMIGEVWLAGGQSNMAYLLDSDWSSNASKPEAQKKNCVNRIQLKEFLDTLKNPEMIRGFAVPRNASGCEEHDVKGGSWVHLDRKNAPGFTAVGNWFARYIQQHLKVAVGIISCNWGGTTAEAWTSFGGLLGNPDSANLVLQHHTGMVSRKAWESAGISEAQQIKMLAKPDPGNTGFAKGYASPEFDDSAWQRFDLPKSWTQAGIAGNGAVWIRCKVKIPASWKGQKLVLNLGPVDKHDITYINGKKIGGTGKKLETQFWSANRKYNVPAELVKGTELTIAIRAYSFLWAGEFGGKKSDYTLVNPKTKKSIALAETPWKIGVELDYGLLPVPKGRAAGPGCCNTPGILFNGMLRPLMPYGIRGVIWYQGESNADRLDGSRQYAARLSAMITDWRRCWGEGDFPFIQVLLAGYGRVDQNSWPVLRESQQKCAASLVNVYSASAVDIGEEKDIHPQNKKEVGFRLAQSALHHVYHETKVVPCGPQLTGYMVENGGIRLFFRYAEGLHFKGGKPAGFRVGSMEEVRKTPFFYDADSVKIEGSTVFVKSSKCAVPLAVRYAWGSFPEGNLYNGANLPAEPFRTDTENSF